MSFLIEGPIFILASVWVAPYIAENIVFLDILEKSSHNTMLFLTDSYN